MLSIETPSDPPSDQTHISFKHDYHPQHLPTFSIRDYVFASRKENIEKNWPFSQHHLQLFSKHDIKDILPPFESPDSVRNQCRRKGQRQLSSEFYRKKAVAEVDHSFGEKRYSGQALPLLPEHERLKLQSGLSRLVIDDGESERESDPSNGQLPCSPQEDSSILSESPLDLHSSQLRSTPQKKESAIEPSVRKCRSIVKLGLMSDQTHSEDITSNITTISDSMASKVCPVCKTFSSTSNTTLNAHIDQCLAVEPTPKCVRDVKYVKDDIKLTKHMTKPAKKRSMVDIYATAKSCTLEELDKRNGSNWSGNSSLLTADAKATADEKRPRLSDAALEGTNDENPVYFDSNGIKIRIISKISNASVTTAGDGPSKLIKDGKESKTILFEVKKNFQLKNGQQRKGKLRNKKLCSLASNKVGLYGEHEMNNGMEKVCHKVESRQLLKARDGVNCSDGGTLRQWVCSKRTSLLRRARTKDNHRGLRFSSLVTINPLTERNKMNFGDSSRGDSDSSGNVVSSPTTTYADTSFYGSQISDSRMDSHTRPEKRLSPLSKKRISDRNGGCLLKLPKSPGKFASSLRSKRVDVSANPTGNTVFFSKEKKSSFRNELVIKPSFSSLQSKLHGKRSILKKPRVHRSITEMDEQVESQPLNIEQQYECGDSSTENLRRWYHTGVTHNSNGSSDEVMREVEVIIDKLSLDRVGLLSSMRGRESTRILEKRKPMTAEEASHAGEDNQYVDVDATIESHAGEDDQYVDVVATIESHVKTRFQKFNSSNNLRDNYDDLGISAEDDPVNVDAAGKTFSRKAGVSISKSIKTTDSEFHNFSNPVDAQTNQLQSSGERHERCLCRPKMLMPFMHKKLCDSQLKYKATEVCRLGADTSMRSEVNSRFVAISPSKCQSVNCGNDSPYFPAPPDSVSPTLWNGNSKDHQGKSSLTSSKMPFPHDERMLPDRGSSESPVSTTSSISHPTKARSVLIKLLNPESCTKPSEVQDKVVIGFSGDLTEPVVEEAASSQFANGTVGAERIDLHGESLKATPISPPEESVICTGDPPCRCLWKMSFASDDAQNDQDLQLLKHCTGESSMNAAKEKQIACNMNTVPEILAKPDSFPLSRKSNTMASNCESPGDSVSTHFRSQDVQSTSNPVLRLMGKNLMVVNQDEDAFVKLRQPTPASKTCTSTMCLNLVRCSPGTVSNQDSITSHFEVPETSVVSSQDSCTPHPLFFSDDISKSFTSHSCSTIDQRQSMVGNCNNVYAGEVDSSLIYHGLKSRTNLQIEQRKLINRLDSFPYKVEGMVAPAHLQNLNHVSAVQNTGNPAKEVILIEDSPESEAEFSRIKASRYVDGLNESQRSPVAVLRPTCSYPSMPQNAFCYHTSNPFSQVEPLHRTKGSYPVLHHGEASKSPSKWGARDPFASRIYHFSSLS